jgi:hypothetical protein
VPGVGSGGGTRVRAQRGVGLLLIGRRRRLGVRAQGRGGRRGSRAVAPGKKKEREKRR